MLAVKGYYDGSNIIMEEDVLIEKGQEVIVTILDFQREKNRKDINLKKYMNRGKKMFPEQDAQDYVRELRDNDRV